MKLALLPGAVLSLGLAACGGPSYADQRADSDARMGQACSAQIASFLQYCERVAQTAGGGAAAGPVKSQASAIRGTCGQSPELPKVDACVAKLGAVASADKAEQDARVPAERARVPELKADPDYASLLDSWKALDHEVLVASDNASVARREQNPDRSRYEAREQDAVARRDAASAKMRALLEKHGIDPRDARVLGVW